MKKFVSVLLSLVLVLGGGIPTTLSKAVAAADTELWINGVDILAESSHTVPCGSGIAKYDSGSNTLLLEDVDIDKVNTNASIGDAFVISGKMPQLKIQLKGENYINATGSKAGGIYMEGDLQIEGDGELVVTSNQYRGVYSDASITISNHANLKVTGASHGIYAKDIKISNSQVETTSSQYCGIYASNQIDMTVDAKVTSKGYAPAIKAVGDITVQDATVDAISDNDIGIYCQGGTFFMQGGKVHARGGSGTAGIAVLYAEAASKKVGTGRMELHPNYGESQGGKVAVSDCFASGSENRSWTSFLAKDAEEKLSTRLSNAMNEVTLQMKEADYSKVDEALRNIPKDLSPYIPESTKSLITARNQVVRGKLITEQKVVDEYATAIEKAIKGLVKNLVAPKNITVTQTTKLKLKISWAPVTGAIKYQVYRSTKKNGTYKKIKTLAINTTRWTDTKRNIGTTYYYKVRAYTQVNHKNFYSGFSPKGKQMVRPIAPKFKLKQKNKKVVVTWTKKSYVNGYQIANNNKGTMKTVKTTRQYTIPKYTSYYWRYGKTYQYKMRTYKVVKGKRVYSKWTAVKKVKIK